MRKAKTKIIVLGMTAVLGMMTGCSKGDKGSDTQSVDEGKDKIELSVLFSGGPGNG